MSLRVPGITGEQVRMFLVSRDGTRLVAVVRGRSGNDSLVVSRIEHSSTGRVLGATTAERISGAGGLQLPIHSIAWRTPTSLAVLSPFTPSVAQVQMASVDGSPVGQDSTSASIEGRLRSLAGSPVAGEPLYGITPTRPGRRVQHRPAGAAPRRPGLDRRVRRLIHRTVVARLPIRRAAGGIAACSTTSSTGRSTCCSAAAASAAVARDAPVRRVPGAAPDGGRARLAGPTPAGLVTPWAAAEYAGAVRAMVVGHKERRLLGAAQRAGRVARRRGRGGPPRGCRPGRWCWCRCPPGPAALAVGATTPPARSSPGPLGGCGAAATTCSRSRCCAPGPASSTRPASAPRNAPPTSPARCTVRPTPCAGSPRVVAAPGWWCATTC